MTAVLIPAYEPEPILIDYVRELVSMGFPVVVADDGSGAGYCHIFAEVSEFAKVLSFPKNRGKGAVLKSLYKYVYDEMPYVDAVITADSDGQHSSKDVLRISELLKCGEKFVLGVRDIGKNAPIMSQIGNDLSRIVFALSASVWLKDNQTGLRGFSRDQLPWMLEVEGDRFDYELSVLWQAAVLGVPMKQIEIQTIYFNNNSGTHFRKIKDTALLYITLARCNRAAVACRFAVFFSLIILDILPVNISFWRALPLAWFAGKLICLGLRKLGRFKGLPMKGVPREVGYSLLSLAITLGVTAAIKLFWGGAPLCLCWLAGRAVALPLRYFFCKILSQMAFSADKSSESSLPK